MNHTRTPPATAGLFGGLGELFRAPAAPAVALLAAALVAFVWANSPWREGYQALLAIPLQIGAGGSVLSKPALLWINDGLMALFFLMVGLEVKREVMGGALSSARKAALPVAAALGGMLVPGLIYASFNLGGPGAPGWAIPMATDIAFALGVLALLGDRVPVSLKVFLAAFAVADDISAVTIIALFYTANLSTTALLVAGGLTGLLVLLNRLGVRALGLYLLVGAALWLAVLKSGVHATVAGVVLALTVPLGDASARSPLIDLEHALHPWVSWCVLPIFALANAGVAVVGAQLNLLDPIAVGVAVGLVAGKLVGIPAMCWLAVRLDLAELPAGAGWLEIIAVGLLGGIGFTMSIFIAGLAFADPVMLDTAKVGVLGGSLVAGTLGAGVLVWASRRRDRVAEEGSFALAAK